MKMWRRFTACLRKMNVRMPAVRLKYRILLYVASAACIPLLTIGILTERLPGGAGAGAGLLLFFFLYYSVRDVRWLFAEKIIPFLESVKTVNRIIKDYAFRTFSFAAAGSCINLGFILFNGIIALYSRSPWFATLAAYYILLAGMRLAVIKRKWKGRGQKAEISGEIALYRNISILFFLMSWVLGGAVILLGDSQGGKYYPQYTIYVVAGYTFYKIILAVCNLVKTGRMKDLPLLMIRRIGYADACVSLLFLQTAMFASFGAESKQLQINANRTTGAAVCLMVLGMGAQGIYDAGRRRKIAEERG